MKIPHFFLFVSILLLSLAGLFCWKLFQLKPLPLQAHLAINHRYTHLLPPPGSSRKPLDVAVLSAIDDEQTRLIAKVIPSVVSIITTDAPSHEELLREFFGFSDQLSPSANKMGSGMIVSSEGHIITNWHVVKDAIQVIVQLNDGRTLPAKLTGFDEHADVAILKIHAAGLIPISLGDSDLVKVGQQVFAIGNPFGLQETVTQGIISAKGRRAMSEATNEFFQTSTQINPGNSGGPLINIHGEVIGINNFIISQSGGAEGLSFAIPSNVAHRIYNDIIEYGRVTRPWFGVATRSLNPALAEQLGLKTTSGALVVTTFPGSPAQASGLQPGDLILDFNGKPIADRVDLRNRVAETEVGKEVQLTLLRQGVTTTVKVKIQEEPKMSRGHLEN
jgi:serine protease Do